jgi:hypothetical protein
MSTRMLLLSATALAALMALPIIALGQPTDARPPAAVAPMPAPSGAMRAAMPTHATSEQRTSRIVGSDIHDGAGTSIGSVDDLILASGPGGMTAVLSVGGFLGLGSRLVTVPLVELRYDRTTSRWTLPGATKDSLTALPAFAYAPRS